MFTPIRVASQLPKEGEPIAEGASLEFKAVPSEDDFEIAKDIASLANGFGGTLLVGAVEGTVTIERYLLLTEEQAMKLDVTYQTAVRDRCQPSPLFAIEHIPRDVGLVVAVNVWPLPGQPVGVLVKPREIKAGAKEKQLHDVYYYPQRVGSNTRGVPPGQMSMLVDAKYRRMSAILIAATGEVVRIRCRAGGMPNHSSIVSGKIVGLAPEGACFYVSVDGGGGKKTIITFPVDHVEAVLRDGRVCHVIMTGRMQGAEYVA